MMQFVDADEFPEVATNHFFSLKYWQALLSPSTSARNAEINIVEWFANYLRDKYVFGKDPESLEGFEMMLNMLTDASLKIQSDLVEPVLFTISQVWTRLSYHYLQLADEQLRTGQFVLGLDLLANLENNLDMVMIPLSTMLSTTRQSFYDQITELLKCCEDLSAKLKCEKMLFAVRETFKVEKFPPEESKRKSMGKEGIEWLKEEEVKIGSLCPKLRAKILVWKGALYMDFIGDHQSAEESLNAAKHIMDLEEVNDGKN